jgi:hypothetical protein
MAVHDWTRVEAGILHDFHVTWIPEIKRALNSGLLPDGYYALAEQHAGQAIADVLTLHSSAPNAEPQPPLHTNGGTAVAEAPPKVRRHIQLDAYGVRRKSLAIRHISCHRLVSLIEIVSPANKDRERSLDDFVRKVLSALNLGVHVLVVDLFPPGRWNPQGIQGAIQERFEHSFAPTLEPYDLPANEPLTLASYVAATKLEGYIEHVSIGVKLPEMPLFLTPDRYVNVPLEHTYMAAFADVPTYWRNALESPAASS